MWYTVLSCTEFDVNGYKAGTIYNAKVSILPGMVAMFRVNSEGRRISDVADVVISREGARKFFSAPTKSFTDAMEQSFMVCEAAYC